MSGPEPSKKVNVLQQDAGVLIPIARKQLIQAGLYPDDPDLEVSRYVFEDDQTIRLRFYPGDDAESPDTDGGD